MSTGFQAQIKLSIHAGKCSFSQIVQGTANSKFSKVTAHVVSQLVLSTRQMVDLQGKLAQIHKPSSLSFVQWGLLVKEFGQCLIISQLNQWQASHNSEVRSKGQHTRQGFQFPNMVLLSCRGPLPVPVAKGYQIKIRRVVVFDCAIRIQASCFFTSHGALVLVPGFAIGI